MSRIVAVQGEPAPLTKVRTESADAAESRVAKLGLGLTRVRAETTNASEGRLTRKGISRQRAETANASETKTAKRTTVNSIWPLHVTAGVRHLITAQGNPFFLNADSPWDLFVSISDADVQTYLDNRVQKGFNAVLVELMEHFFSPNPPANFYGVQPFTTPGDFATPNPVYFDRCAQIVQWCLDRNILVLLNPCYYGAGSEGWNVEMASNGITKCTNFGTYVGNRFASYPNILWVQGTDCSDITYPNAVGNGILAALSTALQTFQATSNDTAGRTSGGAGKAWFKVNDIYCYTDITATINTEYAASSMPCILIESHYEGEAGTTAQTARAEAYRAMFGGAAGHCFGNGTIWKFASGWQTALNSAGSSSVPIIKQIAEGLNWNLATFTPDSGHTFCTTSSAIALRSSADALVYIPAGASTSVQLAQLSGPYIEALWVDPVAGTTAADAASPILALSGAHAFAGHGGNVGGGTDWVLRLRSIPAVWPNEPAGFVKITELDFSVALPTQSDGPYTDGWGLVNPNGYVSRVVDATAPLSPPYVARYSYPVGFSGTGQSPGNLYRGVGGSRYFVGFYWKPSNPWQYHSSGTNKIGFLNAPVASNLILYFSNSNDVVIQDIGVANYGANVTPAKITLGAWHKFEIYLNNAGGIAKLWLNGVLTHNYTGLGIPANFSYFEFDPTWGGTGGTTKSEQDYFWYDHVYISH